MNTTISLGKAKTTTTTTTLFDLISDMQQQAATPRDEALIVPTVAELLRRKRIRFERELALPSVA